MAQYVIDAFHTYLDTRVRFTPGPVQTSAAIRRGLPGFGGSKLPHMHPQLDPADEAVQILRLLAEPARFRVAAALVLGYDRLADIARISGVDEREVARAIGRLVAGGLVQEAGGTYRFAVEALTAAARRAADQQDFNGSVGGAPNANGVLKSFFKGGQLTSIPANYSKRLVILDVLAQTFEPGHRYNEKQVNKELAKFHDDVASLRRHLVDEGFLTRADGMYWRTGGTYPIQ